MKSTYIKKERKKKGLEISDERDVDIEREKV
jgi:hypothetical protein